MLMVKYVILLSLIYEVEASYEIKDPLNMNIGQKTSKNRRLTRTSNGILESKTTSEQMIMTNDHQTIRTGTHILHVKNHAR